MNQNLEEKIQAEIRKRVVDVDGRASQRDGEVANKEALSEITTLSPAEIDRIAKEVRNEFVQKQERSKKFRRNLVITVAIVGVLTVFTVMRQYNTIVGIDEHVKTAWSQVENVYQRRLDLIPNLVSTVQAYAQHEENLFRMIIAARTKASGVSLSKESLNDPAALQQFQAVQGELSSVLQRMMVTVEQNPSIQADQNFLALQAQLEGTENRIAVERKRFNEAVQQYNAYIKKFPQVVLAGMFGFQEKPYFEAEQGAENAPAVNFK